MAAPMANMRIFSFAFKSRIFDRNLGVFGISNYTRVLKRHYARQSSKTTKYSSTLEQEQGTVFPTSFGPNVKQSTVSDGPVKPAVQFSSSNKMNSVHSERFELPPNIHFEKLDDNDKRFGRAIANTKSKSQREKQRAFLLEGKRLILDAYHAGIQFKSIFFTKIEHLEGLPIESIAQETPLYKVKYRSMSVWSDTMASSGLIAIGKMPKESINTNPEEEIPVTLICDNIRDPGNMGTIIRSAAAVGCSKILLTKGCVDVWEPKVLRSGAGAHFRVPLISGLDWPQIETYLDEGTAVAMADTLSDKGLQLRDKDMKTVTNVLTLDEDNSNESDGKSTPSKHYIGPKKLAAFKRIPFESSPYYEYEFSKSNHTAVIIGGETEGLSGNAHRLAFEKGGQKLHIPMAGGVDSLNSAVASAVILFEAKKQLMEFS